MRKKGIIFSSTNITAILIKEMLKSLYDTDEVDNYKDLKKKLKQNNYHFIIVDRTLKDITSKEIFDRLIFEGIENIPPSLLLVQDKYTPELDGEGYSFILRKPFVKIELIEAVNFVLAEKEKRKIEKILIVDDSKTSRNIIKKKLISRGYTFFEAEKPSLAFEIIGKEKPDIIIVDYVMPEMNGVELAKKLAEDEKLIDVPIILLTGSENLEKIKEEGFNSGISEYFQKPINEDDLINFFERYIEKNLQSNILVIDDSLTKRKILYSNLRVNNNRVITAESISKAKAYFEDNNFDFILIDLVLKNESAFDAIRIFRKMDTLIPIIVYSSIADRKNIYKVLELGAYDYIWSPIEMKELLLKAQVWINFYKAMKENETLKRKKLKKFIPQTFIEKVDERFISSKLKKRISSLVYVKDADDEIIKIVKENLRENDIVGIFNKKFFVFFENSDYINTVKICKRLAKLIKKPIKFGICPTNNTNTVEELFEFAQKNIVELKQNDSK